MTSPDASAERSLAGQAAAGDPAAFAALVREHQGAVLRYARRLLQDEAAAEDVLQETLLAAHRDLASWRGQGSLRSWLLSLAHARARQARRRPLDQPERREPLESLPELGARAGWGAPLDPEELTARLEQRSFLERALAALPEPDREVLLLRDVEGLSGEETAAALALGLPAMKSRLHRARLALVAELKKGGFP